MILWSPTNYLFVYVLPLWYTVYRIHYLVLLGILSQVKPDVTFFWEIGSSTETICLLIFLVVGIYRPALIITIMCQVMLSKWLIGLGRNVERVSRMCDVNAFQFSTDQVKMILTLVKSVIRTQNNIKSIRKMHFVKVIIVLILPFGQGESLIRILAKHEPY